MKVIIAREECVSCGSCWEACPALFIQNEEDSFAEIVENFRENGDRAKSGELPGNIDCAREAADLCPSQIITIEE